MRRLPARAWFLISRGVESVVETAGTREAAQVAFFVLLAFPATLLLAIWIASTALDDPGVREEIVDGILDVMPLSDSEGRAEIEELLDGVAEGAGTLGVLGSLVLIWSASGAIGALRHSIGAAWPSGEPLPYFQGKALDVVMTLLVVPIALAALALSLVDVLPGTGDDPVLEGALSLAVTEVLPAIASFFAFLVLFRVLPAGDATWRAAWPGALVAFAGTTIVRYATELYFGTIGGGTASIYGAIAGLLAVSISVYLLAIGAVLGANVSAEAARHESWASVDAEIDAPSEGDGSIVRGLLGLLRSLFVRRR